MPSRLTKKHHLWLAPSFFLILMVAGIFLAVPRTLAFSPNYNPANLIDDPTLLNNDSMSAQDIQNFLSNVGSGLANYSDVEACDGTIAPYYSHCGQTISAAQIIYDAAQAYGINPEAILATLEKEQSLVTDPTPSASQVNCAMGYNSCTNYVGFFTQVDNGTWTLRYNYEGASKDATWLSWSPGANYPCANASSLYSTGLYPGNAVTFADPGGTAETVTLANAASASLYCYTPYVGPYSQTGYSGSYNFVYYFQLWFGSTQASTPYAWAYEGQATYTNSAMTTPTTGTPNVAPGGDLYVSLSARNIGYETWQQSSLHLGTSNPENRQSPFYATSWLTSVRPTGLSASSVPPGGETTFNFTLQAPQQTGTYNEYFNLVDEGITWLNNPGFYVTVNVVAPREPTNTQNTELTAGQSINVNQYLLSADAQSTLNLQGNGDLVLNSDFKPTWQTNVLNPSVSYLAMQTDGNLVEYTKSGQPIWDSNTQGNPGAYVVLQTDGNLVIYSSSDTPLWDSGTSSNPGYPDRADEELPTGTLYVNQFLETDDGNYKLILQGDSNLVLYYKSQPIWATMTVGESAAYLAMQSDGNLVLYNTSGKPIWATMTNGKGSSFLNMQPDGNLVIYNSSIQPTWDTGTNGVK